MSNALTTVTDIEKMANAVAKSGLFGMKKPEEAMALMLIAQAEGQHPALAARDYHIIQGKPALKADAMLARFQSAGGKVQWKTLSDTEVSAEFSHPAGGTALIKWTMEEAKRAGFAGKDNWKKFPRQMLRARVVSEGIRTVFPGVVIGVYTPEEVQDFDDKPNGKVVEGSAVEIKPEEQKMADTFVTDHSGIDYPENMATAELRKEFYLRSDSTLSEIANLDELDEFLANEGGNIQYLSTYYGKKLNARIETLKQALESQNA